MDKGPASLRTALMFIVLPVIWSALLYWLIMGVFSAIRNHDRTSPTQVSARNSPDDREPALEPPPQKNIASEGLSAFKKSTSRSRSTSEIASHPGRQKSMRSAKSPLGLLMFRGSPERTYYGEGPVPDKPVLRWKADLGSYNGWSGTGWTGQPAVVEWTPELARLMFPRGNSPQVEVIVGALDGRVHFFDGLTGKRSRKPFTPPRIDNIKGSVVIDPDGYPIMYLGIRGGAYHIVSLIDYTVLGSIPGAVNPQTGEAVGYWPDFDGSCVVQDGVLYEGGENAWLYRIPLKRDLIYERPGQVVPPMKEWKTVYTPMVTQLAMDSLALCRDGSMETSPCISEERLYVGTQNGMVLGFDCRTLKLRFQYYIGDDTDATVIADGKGYIYAANQADYNPAKLASLCKLNPRTSPDKWQEALVWKLSFTASSSKAKDFLDNVDGGILGTPALGPSEDESPDALIYVPVATRPFKEGILACVEAESGKIRWQKKYSSHIWSSPAVIDNKVIVADVAGVLHCLGAFDGRELWKIQVPGVIESTPAVWKEWIYVGAKDGWFYAFSNPLPPKKKEKQ